MSKDELREEIERREVELSVWCDTEYYPKLIVSHNEALSELWCEFRRRRLAVDALYEELHLLESPVQ